MAALGSIHSPHSFLSSSLPSDPPRSFPSLPPSSSSLPRHPFRPSSIRRPSSPAQNTRLRCQLSTTDAVTEAEPLAAGKGEKFDWFAQWYPVAPICDLDKRRPHAKTIVGLDLVVWWDRAEGRWQVFDDRCPHRLAPLSEGRVDQWGRLQCVYHGWCFDGSGSCKYIPQAPDDGPPVWKMYMQSLTR